MRTEWNYSKSGRKEVGREGVGFWLRTEKRPSWSWRWKPHHHCITSWPKLLSPRLAWQILLPITDDAPPALCHHFRTHLSFIFPLPLYSPFFLFQPIYWNVKEDQWRHIGRERWVSIHKLLPEAMNSVGFMERLALPQKTSRNRCRGDDLPDAPTLRCLGLAPHIH